MGEGSAGAASKDDNVHGEEKRRIGTQVTLMG